MPNEKNSIQDQRSAAMDSVKSLKEFKATFVEPYLVSVSDLKKSLSDLYEKLNEKRRSIIIARKNSEKAEEEALRQQAMQQEKEERVEETVSEVAVQETPVQEQETPVQAVEETAETEPEKKTEEVKEEIKAESQPAPAPKKEQRIVRFSINDGKFTSGGSTSASIRQPRKDQKPIVRQGQGFGQGNGQRTGQGRPFQSQGRYEAPQIIEDNKGGKSSAARDKEYDNKKKENKKNYEDKQTGGKKQLKTKYYSDGYDDDESIARRLKARKPKKEQAAVQTVSIDHAVINSDPVSIRTLSEKIGKTASEIIKQLFILGIDSNINGSIDFETASLISAELGIKLELKKEQSFEEKLNDVILENEILSDNLVERPPVVTVMGHVDHGKTSILDYIRKARVAEGEAGGITQHIGAYTIKFNGKPITFIDTPGHEAFTAMRARGAQVTDIAIIVVAADDGIMPQTVEAINHAKSAGVQIIIAINKIDKPGANPQMVMQQLMKYDIVPEDWGGDNICVPVSAVTGENIDKLLHSILDVAELLELKADPSSLAKGTIIESRLDKKSGPIASVLVKNGTLKISDYIVAGTTIGKVKAMIDDKGKNVKEAGPSVPVSVLGFTEVPNAGDNVVVVKDEKLARQVAEERSDALKARNQGANAGYSLDDFLSTNEDKKDLNIIVKTDVQGSLEALKQELTKIVNDEVKINIVHSGVGGITESDVMLAMTVGAKIVGFNVRPSPNAKDLADKNNVSIRSYRIIYELINDLELELKGLLAPKFREVLLGHAEVRQLFKISGVGTIAGTHVIDGKITRTSKMRLVRDGRIITEGAVSSLKRGKDDAREVASGFDCGIGIENYNDIKEGDIIEAFIMEEVKD